MRKPEYRGAISRKLRRAPVWQRLPAAKHSTKKAMVALKLDVTQDRDTENTVGRITPTAVNSFRMTMSLRSFLERRKSARRPPRKVQMKVTPSIRAERKPLWGPEMRWVCAQHPPGHGLVPGGTVYTMAFLYMLMPFNTKSMPLNEPISF